MRVLAVLDSTAEGGAEISLATIAPHLKKYGVNLEVAFFYDRQGVNEALLAAAIPLWHVRPGRTRVVTCLRLFRLIRNIKPDVVHTMIFEADVIGRTAASLARTPVISSIINDMYRPRHRSEPKPTLKYRLARLADFVTSRFVEQWHAVTKETAAAMAPRLKIDPNHIQVIYRARDLATVSQLNDSDRLAIRSDFGLEPADFVILAAGRQEPQKGFELLLEAIAEIVSSGRRVHLILAGREGTSTARVKELITKLGLQEHVSTPGHRRDIMKLIFAADIVVMPSFWEGIGGLTIEVAAVGRMLICSDLPSLREVISAADFEESAHFVAAGSVSELTQAIERAFDSRRGSPTLNPSPTAATLFAPEEIARQPACQYATVASKKWRSRSV